jgi:hypothetical protein
MQLARSGVDSLTHLIVCLGPKELAREESQCWGSIARGYQTPTEKEKGTQMRKEKWH